MDTQINDTLAVTGISGRFPKCANVDIFKTKLLEGTDMVTNEETRWVHDTHNLHSHGGKLDNLDEFDNQFFGISNKQVDRMDPQIRLLLEVVFEAILDAGLNPHELRGTNTGVFVGVTSSDAWELMSTPETASGYEAIGCAKVMLPNRISYHFDWKGPSYAIDSACSSSLSAMQQACLFIQAGICDMAIVAGTNLTLNPNSSLQFHKLNMFSKLCKSFDANGDGYVRSEAAAALVIQRTVHAQRIYCTVSGIKTITDGYKVEGITFPGRAAQTQMLKDIYKETNIDVNDVEFVEAHGTGTQAGDPQEVNSLADVFCLNRTNSLYIGAVKSNMGHCEAASGVVSIIKVIITMQSGVIPKNLNYEVPNPKIPALLDGRIKVVTENMKYNGGLIGVTNVGFGGTNVHLILRPYKSQIVLRKESIPRLVLISGRTKEAVQYFLQETLKPEYKSDFFHLVNHIFKANIPRHTYRGFCVFDDDNKVEIAQIPSERKSVWFIYPGLGCQWPEMGKEYMKIDSFRKIVLNYKSMLDSKIFDIEEIITSDRNLSISETLVGIMTIEIGFTDLLKELGIVPDGYIGYSMGEIACAYVDGCITASQAILCAYSRGNVTETTDLITGAMASVALSIEEFESLRPSDVYISCHNSFNNITISGPIESIDNICRTLSNKNVFCKKIDGAQIGFHSKYIEPCLPKLVNSLDEIIQEKALRSDKWISTSDGSSYHSVQYQVNNFKTPVRFYEAVSKIPKNALVIEVAPHSLLQGLIKNTLSDQHTVLGLSNKHSRNKLKALLQEIGRLYNNGLQPRISKLYQEINLPLDAKSPMISPLIKWNHHTKFHVPKYIETKNLLQRNSEKTSFFNIFASVCNFISSLFDDVTHEINETTNSVEVLQLGDNRNDILSVLMNCLGIKSLDTVDIKSTFVELGLDSLIAVDIIQKLADLFGINIMIEELREMSLEKLQELYDKPKSCEN